MKNLLRALQFFRPDTARLGLVLALLLLSIAANLLKPWPLALIVDCVLGTKPFPSFFKDWAARNGGSTQLATLAVLIFALHVLQGALAAAHNFSSIQIGLCGLQRVRNEVFQCLQRLSLRFHHGAKSGDLIHRASWDIYSFQTLFQQGLMTLIAASISLVLMVVVLWRVNVPLTLVALGIVPALVCVIRFFGRRMSERGKAAQQADSQVTALVQQGIANLALTQSYTREDWEAQRFQEQSTQARERRVVQHGWELAYWLAVTMVFGLGAAAITWLGANQVRAGALTIGELLIVLAYLAQLYEPLNQLSHVGATLSGATAGVQRVFEILDSPDEVKDAPNARPLNSKVRGEIVLEQVCFAYEKEKPVLRDVTCGVAAGESVAIIGPSGVGKTTLLNLLPRFFDPTNGAILLDGVDLREWRVKDLRARIAVVLQEPVLLPATIAENVGYGRPGATRAEIEAAARAANASEFILKLPQGYDTLVGEGAARLSVGEKQRLNLARAFLKDAPILLLDEPTSALDAESEASVMASLRALMRGRTTLMVAHRLSTIGCVDKVLSLEDGRLLEFGRPAELSKRDGYYARVIRGQEALG